MVTNACEFLTNPCEFLTKLTITEQSVWRISCPKNRNRFDLFVMDSQAFATFYLQKMLANPYECLTNVLRSLQMPCHQ